MQRPPTMRGPRGLHPIFFGSFDWHSCVHGYWLLLRLLRLFPDMPEAARSGRAPTQAPPDKVAAEIAYLDRPGSGGFERPYGWAWLLTLQAEAARHTGAAGPRRSRRWRRPSPSGSAGSCRN